MYSKIKTLPKTSFYFCQKRRQNVIVDCSTRLYYASFHECGCQISKVQITESGLRCYKDTFSARCLAYFKQSGNHALAPHCRSDDLKTQTNKLEFSDLIESIIQPLCVLSGDLDWIVCDC